MCGLCHSNKARLSTSPPPKFSHDECADGIAPGRVRENHFGRKQRTPFAGGSLVVMRAADHLVSAGKVPDEAGGAEMSDGGGFKIEGVEQGPTYSFIFHAASMTAPIGQGLSKAKINAPKQNQRLGGVSRSTVADLAKLTPMTFSIA